jgi:hypothetical protein
MEFLSEAITHQLVYQPYEDLLRAGVIIIIINHPDPI